jgi:hypothetical protein
VAGSPWLIVSRPPRFITLHLREVLPTLSLSGAVFVNFELVESTIPPVGEVEDRHVEDKHWIVHSPVTPEHFSPFARQRSSLRFHCCFSVRKELELITVEFTS